MMPVSKHGDPQLGVDIHLCVVPPSPSPVPLPTPHMSIVFDPFDYVPIIGATVTVCGMKRSTAGTSGIAVHIPPGFPFAPKLPDKDDELFMGSSTVVVDGDPFSFIALPVLSCQIAGMISPFRPKKKGGVKAMVLPTVFNLAIPSTVFVGGPPTISLMGLAFKGAFAALGKFAKSGIFKRIRQKLFKNMKPGFLKCKILRAEPVNILTGEVIVEQEDFALPGRIPISWRRSYQSGSGRAGACGYGWETPADCRLEVDPIDGTVIMRHPAAGPLFFARLPLGPGDEAHELELMDGARLSEHGTALRVRTKEDRVYHFPKALASIGPTGAIEYPVGRVADLCGNWLEFERRDRHLVAIQESAGRRIEVVHEDGVIRELALTVPGLKEFRHVLVRYEYDAAGDLVAVVDALGHPHRFAYEEHHLVRHTDRRGMSFYYEYDSAAAAGWRVVHSWGDGGFYDYVFAYDDILRERRITDSLGAVSLIKLDEQGLPISEVDPLGGMTIFEYDDAGRASAVVDPDGYRTELAYDARGNLVRLALPDGATIGSTFDDADRPIRLEDGTGAAWEQRWDERGLLVAQCSPLGVWSYFRYDDAGQLVSYVNGQGGQSAMTFDNAGFVTSLTDPLGHRSQYAWDVFGNVVSRQNSEGETTSYRWDAKRRLTEIRMPSGATTRCAYDGVDNLAAFTDAGGATTRLEYAGQGQVSARTRADGHAVRYVFDTEERLVGVTNPQGESYSLTRDALGRIVEETDYWGQTRRHRYSAGGRLLESIDPLGRRLLYTTDPAGRVTQRTMIHAAGGAPPFVETFAYDANGRLTACENAHIRIERAYDAEGRLVRETQGPGFTLENEFDVIGNRVRRTSRLEHGEDASAQSVRFSYDAAGLAHAIRIGEHPAMDIERDGVGRIVAERLAPAVVRERSYGADGELLRQHTRHSAETIADVTYGYDSDGNVTRRADGEFGVESFTYDPVGRITAHLDPHGELHRYFVGAGGERLLTRPVAVAARVPGAGTSTGDGWFREGASGGGTYEFDRAGQLVRRHDHRGELALEWDPGQRLVQTTLAGVQVRYQYDPLGRRIRKDTAAGSTRFLWDGDALLAETVEPTAGDVAPAIREYVYYPGSLVPFAMTATGENGRELLAFHTDPNGAPIRLTDGNGRTKWSASYSAAGLAMSSVADAANPIRLQGQYEDGETGLCYNRHRYFAPDLGEFVSQDPIGLAGGSNLYGYGENITRWIDPAGLSGVITNKFPDEELPADGRIIPHTIEDGRIKLDTPGQREFDFVVTKDNQLVIGKRHHLLGDRSDVLAAGQMKISGDGRVRRIDNLSGHYRPTVAETDGFADALRKAGVNVNGATLQPWEIIVDGNGNVISTRRMKPCGL